MTYTPVEVPGFNGLDLRLEAQAVGPGRAVDACNVMFDREGQVRTRYGLASWLTLGGALTGGMFVWPKGNGGNTDIIVTATATTIAAYNPAGTLLGSTAVASPAYYDAVAFGTPTASVMYLIETGTLNKLTSAGVLTTVAGVPRMSTMCVQTPDNRLVTGPGTFAASSPSRVSFSGAGTPETFGATDFVDLEPGDGDAIQALVTWNNQVFAFKSRKFYVFYGNSLNSDGSTVFNYRRIAGNAGVATTTLWGRKGAVAADDGVYFIADDGVYRTTGGPAVKISAPLDPIFQFDTPPPYFTGIAGSFVMVNGIWHSKGMLYVQIYSASTLSAYFVYDIRRDSWTYWEMNLGGLIVFADFNDSSGPSAGYTRRMIVGDRTSASVRAMNPTATSDNGTAIVSRYRSGFWNPGQAGAESVIREWLVDGSGTVNFKTAVNDAATLGTAGSVTLGTAPAIVQGRDRRAVRGRNVSFEISAASGAWAVSRVIANLRGQRNAGLKAT